MRRVAAVEVDVRFTLVLLVVVLEVETRQPSAFSNITLVSASQPSNAIIPIEVTPSGMVILVRL